MEYNRPGSCSYDHFPGGICYVNAVAHQLDEAGIPFSRVVPTEDAIALLPSVFGERSKKDLMASHRENKELAAWWLGVTKLRELNPGTVDDDVMIGLAVSTGWPGVVQDLVDGGYQMTQGAQGALARGALSLCGMSTNSKIHPEQKVALELLLELGADPNSLPPRATMQCLRYGPVAELLIRHGLNPLRCGKFMNGEESTLVSTLFHPDLVLSGNGRKKVLNAFLKAGMDPWQEDGDGKTVVERMFRSVHGLLMLDSIRQHGGGEETMAKITQLREKVARKSHNLKQGEKILRAIDEMLLENRVAVAVDAKPRPRM